MSQLKVYDLVVIGGGSGGLEAGYNTAEFYKKEVLIIDQQKAHGPPFYSALGGTCVNIGCVPKKLMVTGASYAEHIKDAKGFGWNIPQTAGCWKTMMAAKDKAVLDINKSYEGMFNERLVFAEGFGRLKSANEVEILDREHNVVQTVGAKNILIATGTWPTQLAIEGAEHCITSNEAFYLKEAPKKPLIVGGGYIAVEFAGIFNGYKPEGGLVSLCYRGELFLRGFDRQCREGLRDQMTANGINLMFNENPSKIEKLGEGNYKVTFESGKVDEYDLVMVAVGRKAKTAGLGLEALGVEMKKGGGIAVDKGNRTNIPGVYALGDVTDRIQLTPVAIHEGACLAATVFGGEERYPNYDNIASAVFSQPPIGTVGLIEEEALKKHPNIAVYESSFTPLMHNISGNKHKKFLCRVIADQDHDGKVLGVHMLGADTPEIIQSVGIAVKMGAKIKDFYGTIGVHPTSAEELCSMRTPAYTYKNGVKVEA